MAEAGGAPPALLAVAHGTRDPAGPAVVRALLDRVRAMRPGLRVAEAYGELSEPSLEEAAEGLRGVPVVVVPLLLARGYHALVDVPGRAGRLLPGAVTSRPLGPDALLAGALAARLAEEDRISPDRRDAVVLGAAGSADPA
ncbi:CbiX/SirB N-terminal domain-containing protein, partial [Actinomadura sp. NPDC000929]